MIRQGISWKGNAWHDRSRKGKESIDMVFKENHCKERSMYRSRSRYGKERK